MDVREIITHPLSSAFVAVLAIGQLAFGMLEPAWALLSTTAELWFPALATAGATILPNIGFPSLGTEILLAAAVVYFAVKVNQLIDKIENWYANR